MIRIQIQDKFIIKRDADRNNTTKGDRVTQYTGFDWIFNNKSKTGLRKQHDLPYLDHAFFPPVNAEGKLQMEESMSKRLEQSFEDLNCV